MILSIDFRQEAMTGHAPYATDVRGAYPQERIRILIGRKRLPSKPKRLSGMEEQLWRTLCLACWEFDPVSRISAERVIDELLRKAEPDLRDEGKSRVFLFCLMCAAIVCIVPPLYNIYRL